MGVLVTHGQTTMLGSENEFYKYLMELRVGVCLVGSHSSHRVRAVLWLGFVHASLCTVRSWAKVPYPPPFVIATQKYQINTVPTPTVACAQHIQLPTHMWVSAWHECTLTSTHVPKGM